MRKVNISKKSNIRCEHCSYYLVTEKLPRRGSVGKCTRKNKSVKYYNKCNKFLWSSKHTSYSTDFKDELNINDKILCKRCGRVLTDTDSIARGFGKLCYEHRLKALEKKYKRLF